jgi:hypothetical protein
MNSPSPLGEGRAAAPDEESPPYDPSILQNRGAGCPHPALARHPLPVGEGTLETHRIKSGDIALPARRLPPHDRGHAAVQHSFQRRWKCEDVIYRDCG